MGTLAVPRLGARILTVLLAASMAFLITSAISAPEAQATHTCGAYRTSSSSLGPGGYSVCNETRVLMYHRVVVDCFDSYVKESYTLHGPWVPIAPGRKSEAYCGKTPFMAVVNVGFEVMQQHCAIITIC